MNITLNWTEIQGQQNSFLPLECKLPIDTLTGSRVFYILVFLFLLSWFFYLFVLPSLLRDSTFKKYYKIIIDKIVLIICFLLMALAVNFGFYL